MILLNRCHLYLFWTVPNNSTYFKASKLVYKEGTKFVETLPKEKLAAVALRYLEAEHEVALLKKALEGTDMPPNEKEAILKLLDAGVDRTAIGVF